MKDCCKDGCKHKTEKSVVKKWFNYIVYTILIIIVGGALALQLFELRINKLNMARNKIEKLKTGFYEQLFKKVLLTASVVIALSLSYTVMG